MAEDHLSAETRAMLGRPAAERLAWFQTEFWIKYPASDAILARLEELVNKPRRARMPDIWLRRNRTTARHQSL
ncbi:TniB family NTP-binding protein [Pseudoxanthomonas mexicana]